jgi:lipopolysaccharide/colanic/teichoic acid biosynthesis glycosyltransferase
MTSQAVVQPTHGLQIAAQGWLPVAIPQHRMYSRSDWYSHASARGKRSVGVQRVAKRAVDVVAAVLGLLLLSPLMATIALAIVLDSRGPVLYRTYRVGKGGRLFRLFKLRTMVSNAELMLEDVWSLNERQEILFKSSRDPRLTRFGRFLRRYSLDELPQLWNILKGDMSMVGPRPPLLSEYEQFRPEHRRRMEVLPGLTGLWQVMARRDPSFETYVRLDCHYVEHWTLWLDLRILLKTVPAILVGTGE